jgi:hypothetical protein
LRQPTHRDLKNFCENDRWDPKRRTDHWRYTKRLPDGRTLRTKVSFSSGELGDRGLFAAILREQLQVTEEEFWRVVREGGPAGRAAAPVAAPPEPPLLDAATVLQLRKLGVSLDELRAQRSQAVAEDLLRRLREQRRR